MKNRKVIISLLLTISMIAGTTFTFAANDDKGDHVDIADMTDAEPYGEFESDGDTGRLAYDDPSLTVSGIASKKIGAQIIPSSYDLREKGLVTSVKDQKDFNFCWAFATLASIESNLIRKGTAPSSVDLSEAHLGYFNFHGFNKYASSSYCGKESFIDVNNGFSNYLESAATLSRRFGVVTEQVMPYSRYFDPSLHTNAVRIRHQYLLKDMNYIETSQTTKKLDRSGMDIVKKWIMSNGAVASAVYSPQVSEYRVSSSDKIRNYYSPSKEFNHAITIVGWNDNYPKSSFTTSAKPAGNGAWLVKNSYGKGFGEDGYYWVSYYCPAVCQFCSFTACKNDGSQIYQYNGLGIGNMPYTSNKSVSGANTFKARKDVLIDRVGIWTLSADSKVNVKIYAEKNKKAPTSGTKLIDKTFSVTHVGYHTLDLGKNAGIPKGTKFSLIVTVKEKSGTYTLPFEVCDLTDGDTQPANVVKGQSYLKIKGKSWTDIKTIFQFRSSVNIYNATIKGIGKKAGTSAQKISSIKSKTLKKGTKYRIKAKRVKGNGRLVFGTSDNKKADVSTKGLVKAKKKGTVKITVRALPTKTCRSAKKVIKLRIR